MEVAVYDTYVAKPDGATAHFDIIVPKEVRLEQVIIFGKNYLNSQALESQISTQECQFCHVETPTDEMIADIKKQGYYILKMDDIPADLPAEPTRRQLIEYIRARSATHRFTNFRGVEEHQLKEIIRGLD